MEVYSTVNLLYISLWLQRDVRKNPLLVFLFIWCVLCSKRSALSFSGNHGLEHTPMSSCIKIICKTIFPIVNCFACIIHFQGHCLLGLCFLMTLYCIFDTVLQLWPSSYNMNEFEAPQFYLKIKVRNLKNIHTNRYPTHHTSLLYVLHVWKCEVYNL